MWLIWEEIHFKLFDDILSPPALSVRRVSPAPSTLRMASPGVIGVDRDAVRPGGGGGGGRGERFGSVLNANSVCAWPELNEEWKFQVKY